MTEEDLELYKNYKCEAWNNLSWYARIIYKLLDAKDCILMANYYGSELIILKEILSQLIEKSNIQELDFRYEECSELNNLYEYLIENDSFYKKNNFISKPR